MGFIMMWIQGDEMITEGDLPKIEKKMKELASQKNSYTREDVSKEEALKLFGNKGDEYKTELIERPGGRNHLLLSPGKFHRSLPGTSPARYLPHQSH